MAWEHLDAGDGPNRARSRLSNVPLVVMRGAVGGRERRRCALLAPGRLDGFLQRLDAAASIVAKAEVDDVSTLHLNRCWKSLPWLPLVR